MLSRPLINQDDTYVNELGLKLTSGQARGFQMVYIKTKSWLCESSITSLWWEPYLKIYYCAGGEWIVNAKVLTRTSWIYVGRSYLTFILEYIRWFKLYIRSQLYYQYTYIIRQEVNHNWIFRVSVISHESIHQVCLEFVYRPFLFLTLPSFQLT